MEPETQLRTDLLNESTRTTVKLIFDLCYFLSQGQRGFHGDLSRVDGKLDKLERKLDDLVAETRLRLSRIEEAPAQPPAASRGKPAAVTLAKRLRRS